MSQTKSNDKKIDSVAVVDAVDRRETCNGLLVLSEKGNRKEGVI